MLRTRMFSLSPRTPGRTEQMPRTHRSTGTPACDARYMASVTASSTIEFTLIRTPEGRPLLWLAISLLMLSISPLRTPCGATSSRR